MYSPVYSYFSIKAKMDRVKELKEEAAAMLLEEKYDEALEIYNTALKGIYYQLFVHLSFGLVCLSVYRVFICLCLSA